MDIRKKSRKYNSYETRKVFEIKDIKASLWYQTENSIRVQLNSKNYYQDFVLRDLNNLSLFILWNLLKKSSATLSIYNKTAETQVFKAIKRLKYENNDFFGMGV